MALSSVSFRRAYAFIISSKSVGGRTWLRSWRFVGWLNVIFLDSSGHVGDNCRCTCMISSLGFHFWMMVLQKWHFIALFSLIAMNPVIANCLVLSVMSFQFLNDSYRCVSLL